MTPFEFMQPTTDVYIIPLSECGMTLEQVIAIRSFMMNTEREWIVECVKADATPMWMVSDGVNVILDLVLSKALRLAQRAEQGR